MSSSEKPHIRVAIMGLTGSGKTKFAKDVTGRADIRVGEGLRSSNSKKYDRKVGHVQLTTDR